MAQTRFTCTLTQADEPACQIYARVMIMDSEGASARACPRHAVAALDGITGAHVDWTDSRGLNEWERTALELSAWQRCAPHPRTALADRLVIINLGRMRAWQPGGEPPRPGRGRAPTPGLMTRFTFSGS